MLKLIVISLSLLAGDLFADGGAKKKSEYELAIEQIITARSVDSAAVGYAGARTKTYEAYLIIRDKSSKKQLLTLSKHKSANIRAYVACALAQRFPKENFYPLVVEKLTDKATFTRFRGCLQNKQRICDYYYEKLSLNFTAEQKSAYMKMKDTK